MADSREGFDECLENVVCILEGKGLKIRLKSEQKKAIRQLYEGKDLLAPQYILKCELLSKSGTKSNDR